VSDVDRIIRSNADGLATFVAGVSRSDCVLTREQQDCLRSAAGWFAIDEDVSVRIDVHPKAPRGVGFLLGLGFFPFLSVSDSAFRVPVVFDRFVFVFVFVPAVVAFGPLFLRFGFGAAMRRCFSRAFGIIWSRIDH
jgi:hypothetical protein